MSPVGHTAAGLLSWQKFSAKKNLKTLVLFTLIANFPDIDFGLFFLFGRRGLEMHQDYTHNVFFVGLTVLLFLPFFKEKKERNGIFITAYSHLLLDYLTIDGAAPYGFRLFFPLFEQRFNLGVLPNLWKADWHEVFFLHNLWVTGFEMAFFLLPVLLVYGKTINRSLKKEIQNR
jgi:membrane-bound metal-dependent hydrolase YbcI (DUF457 family)